ncbi:L7Ae/L30e/S12e/Gadd45 family ribosomal protein [Dubosiella newyorkensis]|uniref:L7Ae/L30e/S12e/Gadd45 family ribosomal protein n=1 Tax=Dubosiella newyorkensis TaxID=1862672 RepID=UPI0025AD979E|nr:hypothetical protein [Dubosiella newyorkensis]
MNKMISMIQMAMRARKVATGDQVISSIQSRKAKLVSCGENKSKKLIDKCATFHVPIYEIDAKDFDAISNSPISSLSILDENFAKGILKHRKG